MATDKNTPASIFFLGSKIIFHKEDPFAYRLKVIGLVLTGQLIILLGVSFASEKLAAVIFITQILGNIKIINPLMKLPRDEQSDNP